MDVQYINPFITAVISTMEMMVGINPTRKTPYLKEGNLTEGDITGLIGFAERNITGSVALSFPQATAFRVYTAMTGESVSSMNQKVQDCIGELANIVAGGAKTELAAVGLSFHISIPTVIVGNKYLISHKVDTPVVVIPFALDNDSFIMEVTMRITPATR